MVTVKSFLMFAVISLVTIKVRAKTSTATHTLTFTVIISIPNNGCDRMLKLVIGQLVKLGCWHNRAIFEHIHTYPNQTLNKIQWSLGRK